MIILIQIIELSHENLRAGLGRGVKAECSAFGRMMESAMLSGALY